MKNFILFFILALLSQNGQFKRVSYPEDFQSRMPYNHPDKISLGPGILVKPEEAAFAKDLLSRDDWMGELREFGRDDPELVGIFLI